jgi:F-type H+-transporting ATPase subunit epsilon
VQPHRVTVLADTAIRAKDLDEAKAAEAKRIAEQAMQVAHSKIDYARAHAEFIQFAAQLAALRRWRRK